MHYVVEDSLIRSEYAAKPISQTNKCVLDWIEKIPKHSSVIDYGCGKLRYTIPLSNRVKNVCAVDSAEQINRAQIINGRKSSLSEYAAVNLKNVSVYDVRSDKWHSRMYDYALCTNVLSSIPYSEERISVLKNIFNVLRIDGKALITTQYRNSYFSNYSSKPNAERFNDGWIIKNKGICSFYGIIRPEKLVDLCQEAGFIIESYWLKDGSAFIITTRQ